MTAFDEVAAKAYLSRLFNGSMGLYGLSWSEGGSHFDSSSYEDLGDLLEKASELEAAAMQSIWIRMTKMARAPRKGKKGGAGLSRVVPGVWSDIDLGDVGHKHDAKKHHGLRLPANEDEALAIVAAAGLPPATMVVHSGGGLYALWLFDKPFVLRTEEHYVDTTSLVAEWQNQLAAGAESLGLYYGSGVGNLDRVLRLPGTTNRKEGHARPCMLLSDDGPTYAIEAMHDALEMAGAVVERKVHHGGPVGVRSSLSDEDLAGLRFRQAVDPGPFDILANEVGIEGVLLAAGWTECGCGERGGVLQCFTRPDGGSTSPHSAHILEANPHVLVVFSEEAGLPAGGGMRLTAGRIFAHLWHDGDMSAAGKDLYSAMNGGGSEAAQALGLPQRAADDDEADPDEAEWLPGGSPAAGAADGSEEGVQRDSSGGVGVGTNGEAYAVFRGPDGTWTTTGPSAPLKVAKDIKRRCYGNRLRWWRNDWWAFNGTSAWTTYEPELLRRELSLVLDEAVWQKRSADGSTLLLDWNPTPASVENVTKMLASMALLRAEHDMPCWLDLVDRGEGPWIPCLNGVLRVKGRKMFANEGRFFNAFAVPFEYHDDVPEPTLWKSFLNQVLPDEDQQRLLQEFFGYVLSGRMDLEQGLIILGPKRAGKGTIGTVLRALVGAQACAAPSFNSLGGEFGMESLIGKRLAVMGDVRTAGRKEVIALATERLLGIIGNDAQEVNRKGKTMWTGRLNVVFLMLTNSLPRLEDDATAINSRFAILQLRRSFEGREDTTLKERLLEELPGIFRWALDGVDLLGEGEKFTRPESSEAAVQAFQEATSPLLSWVADCAEHDPDRFTPTDVLYASYVDWFHEDGGEGKPISKAWFSRRLVDADAALRVDKGTPLPGAKQVRGIYGIRLRDAAESDKAASDPNKAANKAASGPTAAEVFEPI